MAKQDTIRMYGREFPTRKDFVRFLKQQTEAIVATEYQSIPRGLLSGLIEQESSWGWDTRKKRANRNGTMDYGLTQINEVNLPAYGIKDPSTLEADPLLAIRIGADILSRRLKARNGDVLLALADYNAGQGTVDKFLRGERDLPEITKKYIALVPFRSAKYGGEVPTLQQSAYLREKMGVNMPIETIKKMAGYGQGGADARTKIDANVPWRDKPEETLNIPVQTDSILAADAAKLMMEQPEAREMGEQMAMLPPIDLSAFEPKPKKVEPIDVAGLSLEIPDIEDLGLGDIGKSNQVDPLEVAFGSNGASKSKDDMAMLDGWLDEIIDEASA